MTKKVRILFWMTIILLLAAMVRIIGSTHFSLWTDEGWTTWFVQDWSPQYTALRLIRSRHPPLYFMTLAGWQNLAGNTHIALRFLEIGAGVITTAIVYRLTADHYGKRAGIYAAALFSVLDIATYYNQEVRHYGWLTMAALWTTFVFFRFIHNPNRRRWLLYVFSVTLLMLTHYLGGLIVLVQVFFAMVLWRVPHATKRKIVWAWFFAFLLYTPWLPTFFYSYGNVERGVGGFPGSYTNSLEDVMILLGMLFGGQLALLGSMYLIGLLNVRRWRLPDLYFLLTGIGFFAGMVVLNDWRGTLTPRMISFLVPSLMIFCGYGITQLPKRYQPVILGVSVLLSVVTAPVIQPRVNLPDPVAYLEEQYTPGDLIILEMGRTDFAATYEVQQALGSPEILASTWVTDPPAFINEITPALEAHQRVWVMHWVHAAIALPRLQENYLGYQLVAHETFENAPEVPIADKEVDIYLFERLDDTPVATFDETIVLQDAIYGESLQPGTPLYVDLWWQTNAALDRDYSVGLYLRDSNGAVVAQVDGPLAERPSSQWQPGELMNQRYALTLPEAPGTYSLGSSVYYYETPDSPLQAEDGPVVSLGEVIVTQP
ncbi:glycosyltransferase family 39 protein [Phototrophicus methaneseepsis]|uniref:Glycosyltransferase family 39 protein n=1 Tax=Phototrophicus methaneseepsis TaxID=2710758 RepID=A0A7S8E9J3_9CHLR|nr:glycosyltransferase family 39 protein [Phototrophicus methaneseepsis]QPC82908.1 glycosyltransferase family 39 protein [Phototrophicus methaneseepsis]